MLWDAQHYLKVLGIDFLAKVPQFAHYLLGARVRTHLTDIVEALPRTERVEQLGLVHAADQRAELEKKDRAGWQEGGNVCRGPAL